MNNFLDEINIADFDMADGRREDSDVGVTVTRLNRKITLAQGQTRIIAHGHMKPEDADRVFRQTLQRWGFAGSSEELRDVVTTYMAEAALQGTSVATDLEAVVLMIDGRDCPLMHLAAVAQDYTNQPNPIRVFYRSYSSALVPRKVYEILSNPENREQRQMAAAKYSVPVDKACVCFDMVMDAIPHLELTNPMIQAATMVNRMYLQTQQADVQSRGLSVAAHDTANRVADVVAGKQNTMPVSPTARENRMAFSSLRGA